MEPFFIYDLVKMDRIDGLKRLTHKEDVHRAMIYAMVLDKLHILEDLIQSHPEVAPSVDLFGRSDVVDDLIVSKVDTSTALADAVRFPSVSQKVLSIVLRGAKHKPPTLVHAAVGGPIAKISMLHAAGVPIDEENEQGETPLMVALKKKDGKSAALLVALGAHTEGLEGHLVDNLNEIEKHLPSDKRGNPDLYARWLALHDFSHAQR